MTTAPRLHLAARIEDRLDALLVRLVRWRGWSPMVIATTGYADADGVHVFARVTLRPPARRSLRRGRRTAAPVRTPRGWRSFMVLPASGASVTVTVGAHTHELSSGRGGYVHAELPLVLTPGWHDARIAVDGRDPAAFRVRAVDAHAGRGVVSDVDDTIIITWLPRPLLAAWNTFVVREHSRRPVPGMADLLRELVGEDGLMVYLSTGAWNFAAHLERFIAEHGFPPGVLLLTDWGPTEAGWFRSGAEHKRAALERLRTEHPSVRWTLVGDDGQRDPAVYAAFAAVHPDAVEAVAIRRLTAAQHVVKTGTPSPAVAPEPGSVAPSTTWVSGADGHEIRAALGAAGRLR